MTRATCPAVGNWQALLQQGEGEPDELVRHLETCIDCQHTLEMLAAEPALWEDTAQGLVDGARKELALRQVVERLKTEELLPAENLSFLRPTDKPGLLGLLGLYEVQEEIGRGGMGVVLKALDPSLNRVVAIKVLSPFLASSTTARRRFIREAKAAAAVCHDHIVTVYSVNDADGLPFLVMQYIAGESLQGRLERKGSLELVEIVRIGLQTALGLAAAHARGLTHRDIKPANLLLENGLARVRITDFGLARMTDDVQLTQHGVAAGTPEYMAPEQARGEPIDHRADLFSFGSVLYTLCTGVPAFRGSTTLGMLRQVSECTPTPLRSLNPAVPAWLETLIGRLMAKNPAERFQSAAEVAALLEGYLAHLQQPATVPIPELPFPLADECLESVQTEARSGIVQRIRPRLWLAAPVLLAALSLVVVLVAQSVVPPAPQPHAELYQDFQGGKLLLPSLNLFGPDADTAIKSEDNGLRITLSPTREVHVPVGIEATFSLSGDFEITLRYELFSAKRPANGYGVGVLINVAPDAARDKFAMVGRLSRPYEGSILAAEFWHPWEGKNEPTEVQSGKLRLVREGSIVHCLVAAGLENDFHEILQRKLTAEDLTQMHVEVIDSGSPGNSVDVRLLDLKIRSGRLIAEDGVSDLTKPLEQQPQAESRGWLLAAQILGALFTLVLVSAGGTWLYLRQNRFAGAMPAPIAAKDIDAKLETAAPPISFSCAACGKNLRARGELTGKKVKCSQCGQPVSVP